MYKYSSEMLSNSDTSNVPKAGMLGSYPRLADDDLSLSSDSLRFACLKCVFPEQHRNLTVYAADVTELWRGRNAQSLQSLVQYRCQFSKYSLVNEE